MSTKGVQWDILATKLLFIEWNLKIKFYKIEKHQRDNNDS